MTGICGAALSDRAATLDRYHLESLLRELGKGPVHSVHAGCVGLGAWDLPGRSSGACQRSANGSTLALAFHGSLYGTPDRSRESEEGPAGALLDSYLEHGIRFVERVHGEFTLAVWDGRDGSLHVATDRFRVHPLFYRQTADALVFSSRLRGISVCSLSSDLSINPEAIVHVVSSSVIPTPKTIYREVNKLPPGNVLTYRAGEVELSRYWDVDFSEPSRAAKPELERELRERVDDALRVRLAADGDAGGIGTFLSGGIDSSAVTGLVSGILGGSVKSFSIGFGEDRFNEIDYARIAADAFNAEHHEYFVTPEDTYDAIPILMEAFDEPFGNASAVPTYFCARLADEHGVRFMYAGDGGDELFAGNERYAKQRVLDYYYRIPGWFREPIFRPAVFALADVLSLGVFVKGKKYIQRASIPYPNRLSSYGFFNIVPMEDLLDGSLLEAVGREFDPHSAVAMHYRAAPATDDLDRQLYIDLKLAISDNDLIKVTRATEAAGVIVRYPLLDQRLAEFAARVPAQVRMHGTRLRSFFKDAYADLLPEKTRAKRKHGFGLPIPVWLRTDKRLNEMMHDLVLGPRSIERGYFKRKTLEKLVESHDNDTTSFYGTALWNLMTLELWHRRFQDEHAQRRTVRG